VIPASFHFYARYLGEEEYNGKPFKISILIQLNLSFRNKISADFTYYNKKVGIPL